jgi:hypothetical protein
LLTQKPQRVFEKTLEGKKCPRALGFVALLYSNRLLSTLPAFVKPKLKPDLPKYLGNLNSFNKQVGFSKVSDVKDYLKQRFINNVFA